MKIDDIIEELRHQSVAREEQFYKAVFAAAALLEGLKPRGFDPLNADRYDDLAEVPLFFDGTNIRNSDSDTANCIISVPLPVLPNPDFDQ